MLLNKKQRKFANRVMLVIFGNIIFAMGINLAITPLHLYSCGFTGITQLLRYFVIEILHIPEIQGVSYTGIFYFLLNIPCLVVANKIMGRKFCITTIISIALASISLALIPIPATPPIHDKMLGAMVGGLGTGSGTGMILRAGTSQGGQDLIGVCLAKTKPNFKVGTIGIVMSIIIYLICLSIYDFETVLYSIIFTVVVGMCIDKIHVQNIKTKAMIFTKKDGMSDAILKELRRGVTCWNGIGAYTNDDSNVLVTVISKYEEPRLKKIVMQHDPNAFVILTDNTRVLGNLEKRFTE